MEPVVAMPGSPRHILRQQSLPGLARTATVGPLTLEHIAPKTRGGEVAKVLTVYLINSMEVNFWRGFARPVVHLQIP